MLKFVHNVSFSAIESYDGTWLYMAPEVLSLKIFEIKNIARMTDADIINRYGYADIYSFRQSFTM